MKVIDWDKPIRWVDDKSPAEVMAPTGDGGAWVLVDCDSARRYDKFGRSPYSEHVYVENTLEPRVFYVRLNQWPDIGSPNQHFSGATHRITLTEGEPPKIEEIE